MTNLINLKSIDSTKEAALANYLGCTVEDLTKSDVYHYGLEVFSYAGNDYAVGTDEEADLAVAEYIKNTFWAFNASFLAEQTGLAQVVFDAFVKADLCESANKAIESLIKSTCGIDRFIFAAVQADGRGHFLSGYDGEEVQEDDFFIYKN